MKLAAVSIMPAKIAIIGCGIGQRHAQSLQQIENGTLVAMCDLDEARLRAAADRFHCHGFTDWRTMLDQVQPDGVMVCTPPYVRMPLLEELAERGLAVFCEKPPAGDLATARDARHALARHGVLNSVGFMYRWMKAADYVKALIAQRPVVVCQITGIWEVLYWAEAGKISRDYFYRDRAGGPIVEQGVHLVDVARYVLEDEVTHVHARGANLIHPQSETLTTEETIQASYRWRKGTVGSHVHCWTSHLQVFQVLFAGEDFALTLDLGTNTVTGLNNGETVSVHFDDDYYAAEVEGFCAAILAGDQGLIRGSYADACHTLAVATTAMQSIDLGIDLPVPHW